ncbi:protein kinase domain-containing protein [Nannocystis pusilla]|uniref:protein kinase domain-containing protein n=1 Tax=Nannocystis pusilla TaxID=889268 RepID=UPI003B7DE6BA
MHRHRIIHKDIKPQNLLYNPDTDELKITDFGIASRAPASPSALPTPASSRGRWRTWPPSRPAA